MRAREELLSDSATMAGVIARMARTIWDGRHSDAPLHFVGVRTRGVPLAERLTSHVRELGAQDVHVGAVEITLYRDDLGRALARPVLRGTEIPFDVDGADIVLVDDVLFTGRTVRAALNAICDLGRPRRVRLAVLVDRGHRELPIRADIAGLEVETSLEDRVTVHIAPVDPVDDIVRIRAASPSA